MPVTLRSSLSNDDHYLENSISNSHHRFLWFWTLDRTSSKFFDFEVSFEDLDLGETEKYTMQGFRWKISVSVVRIVSLVFWGGHEASQYDADHHDNDDVVRRFIIQHIVIGVGILHSWGYVHGTCAGRNHLPSRDVRSRQFRANTMFRIHAQSCISILTGIQ